MLPGDAVYQVYLNILREELILATGCTEPIAIAYCAARARDILGELPERVEIRASGNIIKNTKSVVVPGTGGLKGMRAAAATGIVCGRAEQQLQVIAGTSPQDVERIKQFQENVPIEVCPADSGLVFDIDVRVFCRTHSARVRIVGNHTNIVLEQKDAQVLLDRPISEHAQTGMADRALLNIRDIVSFANAVEIEDVRDMIARQIHCNQAIAQEGLKGNYGANIGSILLRGPSQSVQTRAKALAAAGSDARMSGCEMPVVILSGSGNQGITASLPVMEYARELQVKEETLYRALIVSSLLTIYQKKDIGRLSAFCGATCAGCGAGAGIAYLHGGDEVAIAHTVVNALAIISGMVCDGAKPSCAAKIAAAVEAGILGFEMYRNGSEFYRGEGIVADSAGRTIANVGKMAQEGMRETDRVILEIMTSN